MQEWLHNSALLLSSCVARFPWLSNEGWGLPMPNAVVVEGPEFGTQLICVGLNSAPLLTGCATYQGANPFYTVRGGTVPPAGNQVSL